MKNMLLITTATAALLAGATVAMSQAPATPPAAAPPSASSPSATPPANTPSTAAPSELKPGERRITPAQPGAPKGAQRDQQQPGSPKAAQAPGTETPVKPKAAQPDRAQAPAAQTPGTPKSAQETTKPNAPQPSQAQAPVNLTTEQRTTIRETVLKGGNVPRVSKVDFQINVGVAVPRSVHVVVLPATVIRIHPGWRGYMYFVVGDEIVIVEPGTMRIVAVIPA